MVLLLTAAEPPGGCLVSAASCSEVIVTATDCQVACYTAPHPTAATGGSRLVTSAACCSVDPAPPRQLWQHRIVGGRVEHAAPLASDGSAYLLVTTHGGAAPPRAAVVTLSGPGAAPALAAQLDLGGGDAEDSAGPHEEPATHATFSNLARCPAGGSGAGFLLAASLRQGTVHLVRAEQAAGGSWGLSAGATRLCDRVTMEPGVWARRGVCQAAVGAQGLGCPARPSMATVSHRPQPGWWPGYRGCSSSARAPPLSPLPCVAPQAPSSPSSRWRWAPPAPAWQPAARPTCTPPSCTARTAWAAAPGSGTWRAWRWTRGRGCAAAPGSTGASRAGVATLLPPRWSERGMAGLTAAAGPSRYCFKDC